MTDNNSRTSACDARIHSIGQPDGIGRFGQKLQRYSAALFLCMASTAFAADDLDKDKTPGATLQEVVVTAEHRETYLQDTPIAVSAVTGDVIQQDRIINLRDVAARVPSITFDQASSAETFISIRGTTIGNDAAGIDQGVSVFIDDVPTTGFGDDSPDLYDLQSIEVLRGPQGTLFGRNVTGGAVLIHTRKPSFTESSQGTLTYGSNNLMEAQMYLTGPLVGDQLAGKISYDLRRRDNFLPNTALNNLTNGENVGSVRGQLLWVQGDDFSLTLGADYLDDTSQDKIQYLLGNFQPSLLPPLTYGPHATNEGIDNSVDKKEGGGLIKAEWTLPSATLTSISGYRNVKDVTHFSTSGDPDNSVISDPVVQDDQFSEEVRLISAAGQKLTWTTGIFLLHGHRAYLQTIDFDALPGSLLQTCCLRFIGPFVNHQNQHVTVETEAIYGEGTYAFTDALKLTLGGRASREKKSGHTEIFETSPVNPNLATGEYSKVMELLHAENPAFIRADSRISLPMSVRPTATKAAATTRTVPTRPASRPHTIPKKSGAMRPASRPNGSSGESFSTQRYTMRNIRISRHGISIRTRAPPWPAMPLKPGCKGLNPKHNGSLPKDSDLGLTYSYTKGRYRSYNTSAGDFNGNTIPDTPTHMLNANVDYYFDNPLGAGLFRLGADVTYRSKIQFDDANDTVQYVVDKSSYRGLVNLHSMWESSDDKYRGVALGEEPDQYAIRHQHGKSREVRAHGGRDQCGQQPVHHDLDAFQDRRSQSDGEVLARIHTGKCPFHRSNRCNSARPCMTRSLLPTVYTVSMTKGVSCCCTSIGRFSTNIRAPRLSRRSGRLAERYGGPQPRWGWSITSIPPHRDRVREMADAGGERQVVVLRRQLPRFRHPTFRHPASDARDRACSDAGDRSCDAGHGDCRG